MTVQDTSPLSLADLEAELPTMLALIDADNYDKPYDDPWLALDTWFNYGSGGPRAEHTFSAEIVGRFVEAVQVRCDLYCGVQG